MARTAQLTYIGNVTVTQTVDSVTSPASGTNGASRTFDQYNLTASLRSGGTPDLVGEVVDISRTLAAVDEDIDLTLAPSADDLADTVNMTGKKLVTIVLLAASTNNAAGVTVKPHPTLNGYNLFGTAGQVTVFPDCHHQGGIKSGGTPRTPAVAAGARVIRVSGAVGDKINGKLIFAN